MVRDIHTNIFWPVPRHQGGRSSVLVYYQNIVPDQKVTQVWSACWRCLPGCCSVDEEALAVWEPLPGLGVAGEAPVGDRGIETVEVLISWTIMAGMGQCWGLPAVVRGGSCAWWLATKWRISWKVWQMQQTVLGANKGRLRDCNSRLNYECRQ